MLKTLGLLMLVLGFAGAAFLAAAESPSTAPLAAPATSPSTQPTKQLTLDLGNKVTLKLVLIPAGKFLMGSPETEQNRDTDEVQHEVTISRPFYMGVTHVTVDQYAAFVKDTGQKHDDPSFMQTGDHPVVNVSWDDSQAFCTWLSKKSGKTVVLPTEAQWEYACRAGSKTRFSFGDKGTDLGDYAWYVKNSGGMTHSVGQKKPNPWGLYDMLGNASQWCQDRYGDYDKGAATDPTGAAAGNIHVYRGGSWFSLSDYFRSAKRSGFYTDFRGRDETLGFRVVAVVAAGVDLH